MNEIADAPTAPIDDAPSGPVVPEFAFDPSDPWTQTFQEGLRRANLAGKCVYEVGIGTGMNAVFLLRSLKATVVSGSDLDPRLTELATRNVQSLAPEDAARFAPVPGAVSLIDTGAARAAVAASDTIIACLPQVTSPDDEKFALFRDAHDVELGEGAEDRSADHIAHYYPWKLFDCLPFNAVGLGLNEALVRRVQEVAPEAELVMNFGARVPKETICKMFEANGYVPEVLYGQIVKQDAGTDISFFVTLEMAMEGTGLEHQMLCAFFADPDGKVPLSARQAQAHQEQNPDAALYHEVCVIRATPAAEGRNSCIRRRDMTDTQAIHGVYLSETLNLEQVYGFALNEQDVVLHRPETVSDPTKISFAVCWLPGDTAFDPYPNLSVAMSIGAGVDALLAHPGLRPDMAVARVRDPHQAALMAGYAVHEVLHYERGFGEMMANAAKTLWKRMPMRPPERAVVAVLGNGTMGQAIVDGLQALDFTVHVACRSVPDEPREGVRYHTGAGSYLRAAEGADYLINTLPLTPATENVLNADLFARMKTGSRLIQIGRGEHLVEADLTAALETGQLAGASLDVFRTEPLPEEHAFWQNPQIRITPHIASDSTPDIVCAQVVETARALRDGTPLRLSIDRSRGY